MLTVRHGCYSFIDVASTCPPVPDLLTSTVTPRSPRPVSQAMRSWLRQTARQCSTAADGDISSMATLMPDMPSRQSWLQQEHDAWWLRSQSGLEAFEHGGHCKPPASRQCLNASRAVTGRLPEDARGWRAALAPHSSRAAKMASNSTRMADMGAMAGFVWSQQCSEGDWPDESPRAELNGRQATRRVSLDQQTYYHELRCSAAPPDTIHIGHPHA